jgi:putative DNA primase/helicase
LSQALTISSTNNEQRVTLVEGEPDCWTMGQAGLAAVSFTGGAATVPDGAVEILASSDFTHVDVIYDLDTAGLEGSWRAAAALESKGMTVRVLSLPETLGAKADVSTFYARLRGDDSRFREELAALEEAPKSSGALTLEDQDTSDADNASRLIDLQGDVLRFVPLWKKWLVFSHDEQRWIRDDGNVHVFECAKDVGQNLKREALTIADSRDAKKKFGHGLKCLSKAGIESMVKLARGVEGVPLDHELLDSDPWKLGVKNGVVDLRSGELRPAVPDDLMTMQCAVAFDPKAKCRRWNEAMQQWFPDPEVLKYVQRLAGSALVGVQRDHVFAIMYGGGRNGKGTFIRALQRVFGAYATTPHLSLLTKDSKDHDTVKASLFRCRLAVASETEHRVKLDEASVKNLTGRDRINCHRMREDEWEFDPSHSLWLQTNHLPKISGTDTGIWSRIRVVKWETTFSPEKQVKDLDETLAGEAPGILNWLLAGCLSWQKPEVGLNEPESVKRETLAYRDREDVIKLFISDVGLALDPSLKITSPELQELLEEWSTEAGVRPPKSALKTFLETSGCTLRSSRIDGCDKRIRVWKGFGVQQTEDDDEYERDEREGMQQH